MITKFLERADGKIVIEVKAKPNGPYPAIDFDAWSFIITHKGNIVTPGDVVAVATKKDEQGEYHSVILSTDSECLAKGFGGNMDPKIRKFHGWRGSYNNVAFHAYGVRKIESIVSQPMANGRWKLKIVLGRDLVKDKP